MAQLKLSQLNQVTSKENTDLIYVARNGTSRSITTANLFVNALVKDGNGIVAGATTDSIREGLSNLYFTNTKVLSAIQTFVTSDTITEGSTNLYFDNTRARGVFTAGENITIESNGLITAQIDLGTTKISVDLSANTTGDLPEGANLYFTNARVAAYVDSSITTSNIAEGSNPYYTNARVDAFITDGGITTSNLTEGDNLYFTNARAVTSLTGGNGIVIASNGLITANIDQIDTSNIRGNITGLYGAHEELYIVDSAGEGNLYGLITPLVLGPYDDILFAGYPNKDIIMLPADGFGRVLIEGNLTVTGTISGAIEGDVSFDTANVPEAGGNLYFTNDRAIAAFTAGTGVVILANGMIIAGGSGIYAGNVDSVNGEVGEVVLTTANITEDGNLYFTNDRVIAALSTDDTLQLLPNGLITADIEEMLPTSSTDSLPEGSANLYFSNERVVAALTAGPGVHIDANGMISFNAAVLQPLGLDAGGINEPPTQELDGGGLDDTIDGFLDYGEM